MEIAGDAKALADVLKVTHRRPTTENARPRGDLQRRRRQADQV
jgi:hypothetical protein